jgi:hypothetical protein
VDEAVRLGDTGPLSDAAVAAPCVWTGVGLGTPFPSSAGSAPAAAATLTPATAAVAIRLPVSLLE